MNRKLQKNSQKLGSDFFAIHYTILLVDLWFEGGR